MKISSKMLLYGCVATMVMSFAMGEAQEPASGTEELPPGMTAEQMAAWEKATKPGPEHAMLAAMAGSWTFEGTFWMAPGAPAMTTTGTAEREMILDGRVLREKVTSEWQGEVFEGVAMTGFDNVSGTYWGTWVDSMSTGIMVSSGSCSDESCEFKGSYSDPMTGGPKQQRMTLTTEGDQEVHEAFDQTPDGEFKSMRLVYSRCK